MLLPSVRVKKLGARETDDKRRNNNIREWYSKKQWKMKGVWSAVRVVTDPAVTKLAQQHPLSYLTFRDRCSSVVSTLPPPHCKNSAPPDSYS